MHSGVYIKVASVSVAVLMLVSAAVVLTYANQVPGQERVFQAGHPASLVSPSPQGKAEQVMSYLHSRGIPGRYVYLPNFDSKPHYSGAGIIGPSYTSAPAPFGIGAYGVSNSTTGVLHAFNVTTGSIAATVNMSSLSDLYVYDDGPTSITLQLNAVLDNVALFGDANYSFWTQNVMFYSARTHSLLFLDNLWNFSSSSFTFTRNSLYSFDGHPIAPVFYYDIGPSFSLSYPFSVTAYLNTSLTDGRSTVYYNYSVTSGGTTVSGSYDEIQFNSTPVQNPNYVAPSPTYLISGNTLTPTGFIPYDAEIIVGGPGGGSTANVNAINATMQLKYLNSAKEYASFNSTYDVGSETGETSQGIAVAWNPSTESAMLSAGPSFVYGMWGINNGAKMNSYAGTVAPSNSFLFASPGRTFSLSNAAQVPLALSGKFNFSIPLSTLSFEALLSDYEPSMLTAAGGSAGVGLSITLSHDSSMGIYTPLYAFNNQQVANISSGGNGTSSSPYVLVNNPSPTGVSSIFGEANDYFFNSYYGVLLSNVTVHTEIVGLPLLNVSYTGFNALLAGFYGLPLQNYMGTVIYDSSNISIVSGTFSGWFSSTLTEFPVANLLLWNSVKVTVKDNYFFTMDSSMLVYDNHTVAGHNIISGNVFYQDPALSRLNFGPIDVSTNFASAFSNPVGLTVYSSHNTVYDNVFDVYVTAISPNYSIYSGNGVAYADSWNYGHTGNYWWNFNGSIFNGDRLIPFDRGFTRTYNNNGLITSGYDLYPSPIPGAHPAGLVTP
ncbi:MAG: thermopsin family protease [Thermoplasmata archaeon YP2-bin.285]|uniref:Thermopsin family protease n=1 Tax=Candidatus Sysuiplasma superficiale TaxID=2823368 RepID=A0A8J8CBZ9_9ARCH|nr:thermopsin family protease [Candidatus Sysuiplasma superficiale]